MFKVLITDDHPIIRQGIKQILSEFNDISIVDEATDGCEMIKMLPNKYHVLLLDISLPGRNGLDYIQQIKASYPDLAILILSVHPEEQYAIRAFKEGASGYLTKSSASEELIVAIRQLAIGKKYISNALAQKIAFDFNDNTIKPIQETLSARELEVLKHISNGKTLNDIAEIISLSPKTISTYRERILVKLNLNTTADLIRFAIKNNLDE